MYKVSPEYVHIKSLSRLCPIVKSVSCLKMCLDNDWTKFGFPSPISVQTHLLMTEFWQPLYLYWTGYGQTLYMDRLLTDIWQRLDRDWIFCPMSVQCLSDHTRTRSTVFCPLISLFLLPLTFHDLAGHRRSVLVRVPNIDFAFHASYPLSVGGVACFFWSSRMQRDPPCLNQRKS